MKLWYSNRQLEIPYCEVDGSTLPVNTSAKCLGYWWVRDLTASKSVNENIRKARRTFFHYGSLGTFQGDLNPLSTGSIIQTCVMPVLMYGSENWLLTINQLNQLDSFLGEMAKRALKWPRHFSNTAALVTMGMESIRVDLLIRKLSFLKWLLDENAVGIGSIAVKSLMDDPESIYLVKECRSLEGDYGTSYTDKLLTNADEVGLREMKNDIRKCDKARLVRKCTTKAPLIVEVNRRGCHWCAIYLGLCSTVWF